MKCLWKKYWRGIHTRTDSIYNLAVLFIGVYWFNGLCNRLHTLLIMVLLATVFYTINIWNTSSVYNSLRYQRCKHRHKKWKGTLDRVLFAAELEFPKILVPRLPQHTSNVNIECGGKSVCSRQLYYLYVTSFL